MVSIIILEYNSGIYINLKKIISCLFLFLKILIYKIAKNKIKFYFWQ